MTTSFFDEKRVWSKIKDEILQTYLTPYLAKVSRTYKPVIIADCFAGKGRFADGEAGSPLIISNTIERQLANSDHSEIKGVFIEKKYFEDLIANLPKRTWIHTLDGSYENRIEHFIEKYDARKQNLFLYVDPYGIKSILLSQFERISKKDFNSIELLLNFNSFGFLREACRLSDYEYKENEFPDHYERDVNTPVRLDQIAGGDYWREIISRYYRCEIDMKTAEENLVIEYCIRLKKSFKYVINIPIKDKLGNIPKYRIIFGTNHIDGLFLMVENMNNRWIKFCEESNSNQSYLFNIEFPDPKKIYQTNHIEEKIDKILIEKMNLRHLLVQLIEDFGISFSIKEYKDLLKKMEGSKIIVDRRPDLTETGKPCKSWDHMKKDLEIFISRGPEWQLSLI